MTTTNHSLPPSDQKPMAQIREMVAPVKGRPFERTAFDDMMNATAPAPGVTYREAIVGGVPGWWASSADSLEDVAILYLHGGAYQVGSALAYRNFVSQIVSRAKAPAFITDYRLAPEHPFPAAIEDAEATYRGLIQAGYSSIAFVGDSAGGGLALGLVYKTGTPPKAAVVMSPWTDLSLTGPSLISRADADPLLTRQMLADAAKTYLGTHGPHDPMASPLFANLAGHPPILIHVGEDEVLLDDSVRYAQRLAEADNEGQIHIWEGMTHVFPSSVGILSTATQALDNIGEFLTRHLNP